MPLVVISPWARHNYVDHTLTDQSSILRFIEDNWLGGQRIGQGSFDAIAGSINGMFDFTQSPNMTPYILSETTGQPVRRVRTEPSRLEVERKSFGSSALFVFTASAFGVGSRRIQSKDVNFFSPPRREQRYSQRTIITNLVCRLEKRPPLSMSRNWQSSLIRYLDPACKADRYATESG